MEASVQPWLRTGVAFIGAGAIALTPITPIDAASPSMSALRASPAVVASDFQLAAIEWPYILSLPIVRQQIRNWAQTWAVYLGGFAQAGVGAAQSLLAIPSVTIEALRQVLALDFVGAFETVATAVRDSVVAVGQPLLDSSIWRNQKTLAVQTALQAATPQALIDIANGFLAAGNGVTTSVIEGVQAFVAAVVSLDLGNIVDAAVEGTKNVVVALAAGAGSIVAGVESAQRGIATALATEPPAASVSEVSSLRTLSNDTVGLATAPAGSGGSGVVASGGGVDVPGSEPRKSSTINDDPPANPLASLGDPPKKLTLTTPAKDRVKLVEQDAPPSAGPQTSSSNDAPPTGTAAATVKDTVDEPSPSVDAAAPQE